MIIYAVSPLRKKLKKKKLLFQMGNTGQLCTPSWCCPWWIPITVRCSRSTRIIGKQSLEVNILLLKNSNFPMQDKETVSTTQERQTRQSVLFGTDWNWTIWMKSQLGRTSQGHCRTMNAIIPLSCWEPSYCVRELFSLVQFWYLNAIQAPLNII